jgi:hypothetical protein
MADVYSLEQLIKMLGIQRSRITTAIQQMYSIKKERDLLFADGATVTVMETDLNTRLSAVNTIVDEVGTELAALQFIHNCEVRIGMPAASNSWTVDVTDGGKGDVEAAGGTPFGSVFDTSDVVELYNAEDSDHNTEVTVDATATSSKLIFTGIIPGADNDADTSMRIRIKER